MTYIAHLRLLPLRFAQGFGSHARNDIVQSHPKNEPTTFQTCPEQLLFLLDVADARVDPHVENVCQEVDRNADQSEEEHDPLHQKKIAVVDSLDN